MAKSRPALPELLEAVAAYREAGFSWEASELNAMLAVPDALNAAPLLYECFQAADWKSKVRTSLLSAIQEKKYEDAHSLLKPYEAGLIKALESSRRPFLQWKIDWDKGIFKSYKEGFYLKYVADLLCIRARLHAAVGDLRYACHDLEIARTITQLLGQDPRVISLLVQIAMDAAVIQTIERILPLAASEELALRLLEDIASSNPLQPNILHILRSEAYEGLASLRNYNTRLLLKMLEDVDGEVTRREPKDLQRTGLPTDKRTQRSLARLLTAWAKLGPEVSDPAVTFQRLNQRADEIRSEVWPKENDPAMMCFWSSKLDLLIRSSETAELCLRALIQAMQIRLQSGAFPTSMVDIPGEWIDPYTNQPLQIMAGKDTLRVYSLGPDLNNSFGVAQSELPFFATAWNIVACYPPRSQHSNR